MKLGSALLSGQTGHEAGRQLLKQMYEQTTKNPMPPILTTALGKPYFADGSVHFSISHTKTWVFCALSERPIGIDAEDKSRRIDLRLAEKILSPDEKAQFDRAANKHDALLRFWVLKEASGKLSGKGLPIYPNHTNFRLDDPRIRELEGCLVAIVTENETQA